MVSRIMLREWSKWKKEEELPIDKLINTFYKGSNIHKRLQTLFQQLEIWKKSALCTSGVKCTTCTFTPNWMYIRMIFKWFENISFTMCKLRITWKELSTSSKTNIGVEDPFSIPIISFTICISVTVLYGHEVCSKGLNPLASRRQWT